MVGVRILKTDRRDETPVSGETHREIHLRDVNCVLHVDTGRQSSWTLFPVRTTHRKTFKEENEPNFTPLSLQRTGDPVHLPWCCVPVERLFRECHSRRRRLLREGGSKPDLSKGAPTTTLVEIHRKMSGHVHQVVERHPTPTDRG